MKRDNSIDSIDIKKLIREYYEQIYIIKFSNWDDMKKFFKDTNGQNRHKKKQKMWVAQNIWN